MAIDAERLLAKATIPHVTGSSCLTYYEAEEALYRELVQTAKGVSRADTLLIPVARSITMQVQTLAQLYSISMLDLTASTVQLQLQQLELQTRGVRAADALHAATAILFDADLMVSTDESLLKLDGVLVNARGHPILSRDTDGALAII